MPILTPFQPLCALVVLVTLCVSQQAPAAVNAQSPTTFAPVYNFNNGTFDSSKTCSVPEWSRIQTVVGNAIGGSGGAARALLRSPNSNRRKLAKCSDCGGRPLCLATIGLGCALMKKRRRLTETQDEERSLATNHCSGQITAVDSALGMIKTNVSAPCQALLNAPRHVQCAEYTRDCDIYGLSVVLAPTPAQTVVSKLNTNGTRTTLCLQSATVTIRAETNFFLGSVSFIISGRRSDNVPYPTKTYVEGNQPYVSFGKSYFSMNGGLPIIPNGAIRPTFTGQRFFPGTYTVTAFSQDDPLSRQTATFVVAC